MADLTPQAPMPKGQDLLFFILSRSDAVIASLFKLLELLLLGVAVGLAIFAFLFVIRNGEIIRKKMAQITGVSVGSVSIDFEIAKEQLEASVQKYAKLQKTIPGPGSVILQAEKDALLRRLHYMRVILRGRRILWVDDHPENNDAERHFLENLGATISFATTNATAMELLERHPEGYRVVISDIVRENSDGAKETGLDLLNLLSKSQVSIPIIYYITNLDKDKDLDQRAFGITNRPPELMHLVLDAMARNIPGKGSEIDQS